ncbi:hypothetical protein GCM10022278_02550 [Allohahella marinimesophila]|uniref:Uncharacterized protein n=1 Tax=Allohahella marinimesophila TaxID=1054972 RepID=A0ABP7NGU9_9GAMM
MRRFFESKEHVMSYEEKCSAYEVSILSLIGIVISHAVPKAAIKRPIGPVLSLDRQRERLRSEIFQ